MNVRLLQLGAETLPEWTWEVLRTGVVVHKKGEIIASTRDVSGWHMLPAYMAEALRERVLKAKDSPVALAFHAFAIVRGEGASTIGPSTIIGCWLRAPVDARIAAALVELERITLGEARELVEEEER